MNVTDAGGRPCDTRLQRIFDFVRIVICGICELEQCKCGLCVWRASYFGWRLSRCVSSSVVDITGAKEMYSVSVGHSKVLRFLVVG